MKFAPIIILAYNRPLYLERTLTALKNNNEAAQSDLYIYCDGPKANSDEKDIALIRQVRELANAQQWCRNVYVKNAEVNKGLSRSVVDGVTEVINKYGKIIVLEDDIVVAPFFLKYMNEALDKYENEERVATISGYNYPIGNLIKDRETFFLKAFSSWGWGTWQRAWKLYQDDAWKLLQQLEKDNYWKEFNFENTHRYIRMLKMTIAGKIDSWAIRWYATIFLNNKVTLFPVNSLVKNIGMIGTHIVGDNSDFLGSKYHEETIKDFEKTISENYDIRKLWQQHYKYYNRRKLNYRNFLYAVSKVKMKYKF
jgi:hypothetical protein